MARKRRSKTNRLDPLTDDQTLHLLIGWCFNSFKYKNLDFPFDGDEHRRQLWEYNCVRVVTIWFMAGGRAG